MAANRVMPAARAWEAADMVLSATQRRWAPVHIDD